MGRKRLPKMKCAIIGVFKLEFVELFGGEATLGPLFEGAGKNL